MGEKNYQAIRLLWFCLLLAACKKDKPSDIVTKPSAGSGVYIVCEGSYGNGNASLGLYVPATDSVYKDVYKAANGQPLGDIFQSMQLMNGKLFLCVNNSDKIAVIGRNNWLLSGVINIRQPRYILPVNDTEAYVSSLYNDKVYIINPVSLQLRDSVSLGSKNTESMLLYNNIAYVCAWDTTNTKIYGINTNTNIVSDTIDLQHYAPQEILIDKEQKIWVLSGNAPYGYTAALTRIDPASGQILKTYAFPAGVNPVRPVFNNTKDTLYFIEADYSGGTANNGIFRMNINDASLPQTPFVAAGRYQYFWALGVDPLSGNVYIGDPKGFIQQGAVYIYSPGGTLLHQFSVGVGPGHFFFDE